MLCTCVSVTLWSIYANEFLQVITTDLENIFAFKWMIIPLLFSSSPTNWGSLFPSSGVFLGLHDSYQCWYLHDSPRPLSFLQRTRNTVVCPPPTFLLTQCSFQSVISFLGYHMFHLWLPPFLPFLFGALPSFCRVLWNSPSSSASPSTSVTVSCLSGSCPSPFKRDLRTRDTYEGGVRAIRRL